MIQAQLNFDAPHNRTSTSIAAAARQTPNKVQADRAAILAYVEAQGGATRDEIEVGLTMSGNTVRPRVWELLKSKALVETNEKRRTRTGSPAVVLEVKS